jgi:two-component system response regulator
MPDYNEVEILLAEDNPRDAEMTQRALRKINFANKVHWVKDGEAALNYLTRQGEYADRPTSSNPKLVLLDIKMPKVDGIEVLRQIKSSENLKKIPVVVMTSSNEERDVIESYRLGVNSYIVKPVEFSAFAETVARAGLYWILTNRAPGS